MTSENGDRIDITKVGRWTYNLALYPAGSLIGQDGGTVYGLSRARRRARRDLRRYGGLGRPHHGTVHRSTVTLYADGGAYLSPWEPA